MEDLLTTELMIEDVARVGRVGAVIEIWGLDISVTQTWSITGNDAAEPHLISKGAREVNNNKERQTQQWRRILSLKPAW